MATTADRTAAAPEALLAAWREGRHPRDLAALFDATAPDLFRLALHLCPEAATAEDVLQETFLAVLEHPDAYEPGRPAMPWLTGVLRNQAGMARRRSARRPDPRRLGAPPPGDDPALESMGAEERERLGEAMQRLPEPYRGVALLRWRYGLEPSEIADVKGVPPGTVWSWLHRAVARLKVEMGALPALMLAFRPERGIDGVRSAVLRQAAAAAAGAAASAATVTTMGGFLMANKAVAAVAALAVLGVAGWYTLGPGARPAGQQPGTGVSRIDTVSQAPSPPKPDAPATPPPPPAEPALPDPVDLSKCDRDLDLFGTVVDEKDRPVAGATVKVCTRGWRDIRILERSTWQTSIPGPSTRSARDGTFVLRLPRGSHVDLLASAEGYGESRLAWRLAGERVRIVLRKGATLVVAAKDEEGKPVAGAAVSLHRREDTGGMGAGITATTDTGGRAVFEGLAAGEVFFWVEHPVLGLGRVGGKSLPATGSITVDVVLPKGRTIRGRVTDAGTGKAIAGATVAEAWILFRPVRTDAEGRYEMTGFPPVEEDESLYAEAPGYARSGQFSIEGGTADFALRPADSAVGRLLTPEGEPVSGASVAAVGMTDERPGHRGADARHAASGPDGRFRIEGLSHAVAHTLIAEAPGQGKLVFDFPPAAEEGGTADLGDRPMPRARAVEGVLQDAGGAPLPDRIVALRGTGRYAAETYLREIARRTDDLGRFRFHGIAPGNYTVALANVAGQTPAAVDVAVPEERDVLDVVLQMPAGGDLRVLVTDPDGKPLEGIALSVQGGALHRSARTDAGGRASFPGLPRSEVRIVAFDIGRPRRWISDAPTGVPVTPEGQEVRIVLQEVSWIRGRVLAPDGAGLPDMQVSFHPATEKYGHIVATGPDGSFEAGAAKGVPMVLEVNGYTMPKGREAQKRTPFKAGPVEATAPAEGIEIRTTTVESDRRITVRVIDLEGKPVANFAVGILKPGERSYPTTDAAGEVTVEGLFAEEIQFTAFASGAMPGQPGSMPEGCVAPSPVKVVPEGQTITLPLRKGVPLSGIVFDVEGRPAEGIYVTVQTADYAASSTRTDAGGRFRVFVPPGQKIILAQASEIGQQGKAASKGLSGADLEKPELEFRLEPAKGR